MLAHMVWLPVTVLVLKRGLHALGSAARSARTPRTTRASCRYRRTRLDAAGGSVRNRRGLRAHGGTTRAHARSDRHPRRGAPGRDSGRARRRPGTLDSLRAVPPGGTRPRALLARILAAGNHRRRRHHRRLEGWHPDGHDPEGARSRRTADRRHLTITNYVPTFHAVTDARRGRLLRWPGRHRTHAHGRRFERGRAAAHGSRARTAGRRRST